MSEKRKTIRHLIDEGAGLLNEKGIPTPRLDAELLLAMTLHQDRSYFFMYPEKILEDTFITEYRRRIEERGMHKPFQYIVGSQEFMGLPFKVNPHVLIPRPDTEILVEAVLARIKDENLSPLILDIGTGSGAISVSLAAYSDSTLYATDINQDALALAKENAIVNGVESQITFLHGHLLEPVQGKKFDIILSNPPYISKKDMEELPPSVKNYEPHQALYGGTDGLDFYREIIEKAPAFLRAKGWVFFEIGYNQGDLVKELFEKDGIFENVQIMKDLSGLDRVVSAQWAH